jgi:hypothetical protein
LLACGLLCGGGASAASWNWEGTLASWQAGNTGVAGSGVIKDLDGDTTFTLLNACIPVGLTGYLTLSEVDISGKSYYDVGLSWSAAAGFPSGYSGGGVLAYTVTSLNPARVITSAAFDTVVTGTNLSAKATLADSNGSFASLTSTNGSRDPVAAQFEFAGRSSVDVKDTFAPSTTGVFQDAHNAFGVTAVPEPESYAMMLAGLAALGIFGRRRTKAV